MPCSGLVLLCADVNASSIVFDPVGDRFSTLPPGYPDITSIETTLTSDTITFVITFAETIAPFPPTGPITPNMIAPRIDLDTDQNPSTGFIGATTRLSEFYGYPPLNLGTEFTISVGSSVAPYEVRGLDSEFNHVAFVVPDGATYGPNFISIMIPLTLLHDDGLMNYGVVVFGGVAVPSDRAPNGTTTYTTAETPVPESTTFLLLCAGLAGLATRLTLAQSNRLS
jgi:hypothetical protein